MTAPGCRKGREAPRPNATRTGRFKAERVLGAGIDLHIGPNAKEDRARGRRIMAERGDDCGIG